MELKVSMIIMSHLSDLQSGFLTLKKSNHRINFVKFLVLEYPDTEIEVDADKVYATFTIKHPTF